MSPLRILVTAGPTREPVDPVRFLSNRSSGKMGYALAKAAIAAGHRVTLVSGPVSLQPPSHCQFYFVETAADMRTAVLEEAKRADIIIMAAAVADYQSVTIARSKIKKERDYITLRLKKTPDILAELGHCKTSKQLLVGFAAETSHLLVYAKQKLKSKNLDFIIANRVGKGRDVGFESDDNQVILLDRNGHIHPFPCMDKKRLARRLIAQILQTLYRA